MVHILTFVLVIFVFVQTTFSQPKKGVYKLWIYTIQGVVKSGYLREVNDSVIVVSPQPLFESPTYAISGSEISSIKIRKRDALWKGTVRGAAAGGVIGGIIGYAAYEEPDCSGFICIDYGPGLSALGGASIGLFLGGLFGLAAGSASEKLLIQGDPEIYRHLKFKLSEYIIQPAKRKASVAQN